MAEMIWCRNCRTVIWAYDHQPKADLRGIANMWNLECPNPECRARGNFDGWGCKPLSEWSKEDISFLEEGVDKPICDEWSAMKSIAKIHEVAWKPSGDNTWSWRLKNG